MHRASRKFCFRHLRLKSDVPRFFAPAPLTMPLLSRTVRFTLSSAGDPLALPKHNTHAGWPPMIGLGAAWSITVEFNGDPDEQTGYLIGIDRVDAAVREHVLPWLLDCWRAQTLSSPAALLPEILSRLTTPLTPAPHAVTLEPEPMCRFRLETTMPTTVTVARRYEFSASHRLAQPHLDDDENRRLFGKCSNPNGHGHNYEVEVEVDFPLDAVPSPLTALDQVVEETLISRFDHVHLNEDLDDFKGSIASVENIAERCMTLLLPQLDPLGGTLRRLTLWETPRTSCTVTP